jgi:hypothetical protein
MLDCERWQKIALLVFFCVGFRVGKNQIYHLICCFELLNSGALFLIGRSG